MNAANDQNPDQLIASAPQTAAPGRSEPETLIIGGDPQATRHHNRAKTPPPTQAGSPPSTLDRPTPHVHILLTAVTTTAIILAALTITMVATGHEWRPCPNTASATADLRQLRQLSQAEHQALIAADTNRLNSLLATDFTLITPDGDLIPRKDLIAAVGSGDLDFQSFRIDESGPNNMVDIRLDCDIATISYRSQLDVTSGPLHFRHDARHTDTWIRSGRSWKQLQGHTTAVGGFPPPGQ